MLRQAVDTCVSFAKKHPVVLVSAKALPSVLICTTLGLLLGPSIGTPWVLSLAIGVFLGVFTEIQRQTASKIINLTETLRKQDLLTGENLSKSQKLIVDLDYLNTVERQLEYTRRSIGDSKLGKAMGAFLSKSDNRNPYKMTISKGSKKSRRRAYLDILKIFVASSTDYLTVQPGLPFFRENYQFFDAFHRRLESCTRVITNSEWGVLAEDEETTSELKAYAYEAGKRTSTIFSLHEIVKKIVHDWETTIYDAGLMIAFSPTECIEKNGDLVLCNKNTLISYTESDNSSVIHVQHADADMRSYIEDLAASLAPDRRSIETYDPNLDPPPEGKFCLLKGLEEIAGARDPFRQRELKVHMGVVESNANILGDRLVTENSKIRWMLKSDAYRMGAKEIAAKLFPEHNRFAVAKVSEALELHDSLIEHHGVSARSADILVMEPLQSDQFRTVVDMGWGCIAWTRYQIDELARWHSKLAASGAIAKSNRVNLHIKVNIGANRFGIPPEELRSVYDHACEHEGIEVVGFAAHHPSSYPDTAVDARERTLTDAADHAVFDNGKLRHPDKKLPYLHSRSSGSLPTDLSQPGKFPVEYRVGGALYGVFPKAEAKEYFSNLGLKQAVEIRGRIESFVKVKEGQTVNYENALYVACRSGVIGWMNFGYDDGISQSMAMPAGVHDADALDRKPAVRYRGRPCPIVGVVGMNFCAIDVTEVFKRDIKPAEQFSLLAGEISTRDETILTDSSDDTDSIEQLAEKSGRPVYSILTGFGKEELRVNE